jgi:hypothetical protein
MKGRSVSKNRPSHRVLVFLAQFIDHKVGWDRLPTLLSIPMLVGLRARLREQNLFDTGVGPVKADWPTRDGFELVVQTGG